MTDEQYMQRCLDLAILGLGNVSPNPMVGAVVVLKDKVIGEGYHQQFGKAHAEVNAINDVLEKFGEQAAEMLKMATVYCNLEPCAHYGKTPPCADLLVKYQVRKVVIGNTDPFPSVNGKGIAKLEAAGIKVVSGVLAEKCTELNRRFFTRVSKKRPFIILKWAQTSNNYFAPKNASQKWITGAEAKVLNFKWRGEEDTILVGKQTALIDNPSLTNRGAGKNPVRLLIDRQLDVPLTNNIFGAAVKTIVFNEIKTEVEDNVHFVQMEDMHFYLPQKIAFQLYLMDIQSVIIEGGAQMISQFIAAKLWDEARIFTGRAPWADGIMAPEIEGVVERKLQVGDDYLTIIKPLK